jgi:hypothetical protein
MPENIAQNGERRWSLLALGREQIMRLNGFHVTLESRVSLGGNTCSALVMDHAQFAGVGRDVTLRMG